MNIRTLGIGTILVVALSGCASTQPAPREKEAASSVQESTTSSLADVGEDYYSNDESHFQVRFPANWLASEENNPRALVVFYSTDDAIALDACERKFASKDRSLNCGHDMSQFAIGIYDGGFIDYDALTDTEKWNFPNYQEMPLRGLDAFRFDGRTEPPTRQVHVNAPDGKSGITFVLYSNDPRDESVLLDMLKSLEFST